MAHALRIGLDGFAKTKNVIPPALPLNRRIAAPQTHPHTHDLRGGTKQKLGVRE